jgi:hypothetical protein
MVTDPSSQHSRAFVCTYLWVAVINPGSIRQFTHLAASLQDWRFYYVWNSRRLVDAKGDAFLHSFQEPRIRGPYFCIMACYST